MNILNSKGPNMDPCATSNKISHQELCESLTFTLYDKRGSYKLTLEIFYQIHMRAV